MTEAQKEVLQAYLDDEKQVLNDIKANYEEAIRGIDAKLAELMGRNDSDMANVIYQIDFQKALKAQNEAILEQLQSNNFETVSEYLQKCYENGFVGTMYDLQSQGIPLVIPLDQAQVVKAIKTDSKLSTSLYESFDMAKLKKDVATEIARGFASAMNYAEIARNIQNRAKISQGNAVRIARTEGHRIQCTASMDACEKAKSKGADIVKQWDATLDSRTRESHRMVDGEIRELDERFSNGLRFPSDPMGSASEVINCRCALLQRARWALDESELETLKERAKVHGLYMDEETAKEFGQKKAKDFAEFKDRYLKGQLLIANEASNRTKSGGTYGVNWSIVKSKEYNKKFERLSDNIKANELAVQRSRNALSHRNRKKTEEIYAISLTAGKDISAITNQKYDFGVRRTEKFTNDVKRAEKNGEKILFIHNHPKGMPPSIADLNELLQHKNASGITVGHNGSVYYYSKPNKEITKFDETVAIRKFKNYNGIEREEKILQELAKQFEFEFEKL